MLTGYGMDEGKEDTWDDDLIDLFENGFCNNEESHVACKEKVSKKLAYFFQSTVYCIQYVGQKFYTHLQIIHAFFM